MASPIDAATEAAEFSALVAELEADQGDDVSEEATPEADASEGDPEADEESEEIEEEEDTEALADSGDVDAFKAELADLFDGGDLKAAAEKLGLDPAIFKLNNKQFKAARVALRDATRKEEAAKIAEAGATRAKADIDAKAARAEEHYGPIFEGFQAYKNGDPTGVRGAIERMTGDKFENVVGAIARAAKGLDPGQVEVIKLRRELAERDAAKAKEAEQATEAQTAAADVAKIGQRLAGTPLEGVAGAAEDIAKVMRASIDPRLGKPTKTLKEAYAEVKAGYAKRAAELAKVTAKPKAPEKKPAKQPLQQRATVPAAGKKLTAEQEFAKELEAAKRETAQAERRIRRVR